MFGIHGGQKMSTSFKKIHVVYKAKIRITGDQVKFFLKCVDIFGPPCNLKVAFDF